MSDNNHSILIPTPCDSFRKNRSNHNGFSKIKLISFNNNKRIDPQTRDLLLNNSIIFLQEPSHIFPSDFHQLSNYFFIESNMPIKLKKGFTKSGTALLISKNLENMIVETPKFSQYISASVIKFGSYI